MSYKHTIASNTLYQIINKVITAGATLIISALITRLLGAKVYGEYSIVLTYVLTFFLLSDFGVNAIIVQDFAKNTESAKNNYAKVLTLRIAFGLLLMLFAFLILGFAPYSEVVKLAIVITLPLILFNSITKASELIFQSYLKYQYQAYSSSWGSLLSLTLVALSIWIFDGSLIAVVIATVLGGSITSLLSVYFTRNFLSKTVKWIDFRYWKYVLLDAFPMGMAITLNVLMVHTDRLMLSILSTPYSVGIYSLSYKIFDVVLVLPTFMMNAIYPVLVRFKDESEEKYQNAVSKVFVFMLLAGLFLAICGVLTSPYLIPLIWGGQMVNSVMPFNILMFGLAFFFLTSPLSWVALMEGKKNLLMYIYGIAFVFNAVFNWVFIPSYDYYAAAILTVISEIIVFVLLFMVTRKAFIQQLKHFKFSAVWELKKYVKVWQ